MNNDIKFSIIIPFYNEAKKLPTLINSLINQDFDYNAYEILLIDNMSSDDSAAIATKLLAEFRNSRVILCSDFRSSYAARNVGWKAAVGTYMIFIDADCVADNGLLSAYNRSVIEDVDDEVAIFAGAILPHERAEFSLVEQYSTERRLLNQDSAVKGWAYRPFAQTANAMFPKKILEQVGGFNGRLTSGGDGELCWRILDTTKKRIEYSKEAIVFHWHREKISDLFAQFEKYGIGRFQQSGVVPGFDKGLIGVTRDTIVERFEHLEKQIIATSISEEAQKSLLWSLYDLAARVGNSHGYVGAKSQLTGPSSTPENNIFSPPTFPYACVVCDIPNFDCSPTFAKRVTVEDELVICQTCNSTVEERLWHTIANETIDGYSTGASWNVMPFASELLSANAYLAMRETVFTLRDPESFAAALVALRWALNSSKNFLLIYSLSELSNAGIWKLNNSFFTGIGTSGVFFDRYNGRHYQYTYLKP